MGLTYARSPLTQNPIGSLSGNPDFGDVEAGVSSDLMRIPKLKGFSNKKITVKPDTIDTILHEIIA